MTEEQQEGQKTIVSFIVGLLIGGLLVWAFSGPAVSAPNDQDNDKDKTEVPSNQDKDKQDVIKSEATNTPSKTDENKKPAATLPVGDGKISVKDQPASSYVELTTATYPISEGWVGVRDYDNDKLGGLLGVARFSEEQGLIPSGIHLQRATTAGKTYAIVVYKESGDRQFNLADDVQIDQIFATFEAK